MNDVIMDESKIFDACTLVEKIVKMTDVEAIKTNAQAAISLLNQALEEGERK